MVISSIMPEHRTIAVCFFFDRSRSLHEQFRSMQQPSLDQPAGQQFSAAQPHSSAAAGFDQDHMANVRRLCHLSVAAAIYFRADAPARTKMRDEYQTARSSKCFFLSD